MICEAQRVGTHALTVSFKRPPQLAHTPGHTMKICTKVEADLQIAIPDIPATDDHEDDITRTITERIGAFDTRGVLRRKYLKRM